VLVDRENLSQEIGHIFRGFMAIELETFSVEELFGLDFVIQESCVGGAVWQFSKNHLEEDDSD